MTTALAPQQSVSLISTMAGEYGLAPEIFKETIKKTCMPTSVSNEDFAAFLVVCNRYKLNPILREIHAFPNKKGGITPIVGIDGWISLVTRAAQFDGVEFKEEWKQNGSDQDQLVSVTCTMYRKDRSRPNVVTEYYKECFRATDPWKMMPARMLRHKAYMQCARLTFGFSGIMDEDDAERGDEMVLSAAVVAPDRKEIPPPEERTDRGTIDIKNMKAGSPKNHVNVADPIKRAEPEKKEDSTQAAEKTAEAPAPAKRGRPKKTAEAPAEAPAAEKPEEKTEPEIAPAADPAPAAPEQTEQQETGDDLDAGDDSDDLISQMEGVTESQVATIEIQKVQFLKEQKKPDGSIATLYFFITTEKEPRNFYTWDRDLAIKAQESWKLGDDKKTVLSRWPVAVTYKKQGDWMMIQKMAVMKK